MVCTSYSCLRWSQLIKQEAYKQYQDALDYFMMVSSLYLSPGLKGVADV